MPSKMEMLLRIIRQWDRKKKHHTENFAGASRDAAQEVLGELSGKAGTMIMEIDKPFPHSSSLFPKDSLLFIEACCGCALLSSCVSKLGFEVMPIDFEGNKQRPYMHVVQLDLRKRETWQFLRYVAESRKPFHFHAAPPCGAASRARDIHGISDIPMSSTDHGPPPLRSERWPLGFPNLSRYWAGKVLSANSIYLQLCAFCGFLNTLNTSSTAQGGGGSFKNRKPIGEIGCCESPMAEQKH